MTDDTPKTSAGGQGGAQGKPVTTVTAGTLIMGTYEIEKLINSGGMGEVYRGRNIHNGEPVAIKIVLPSLAHDQKIVALFQKESTVLSRLAHEAIVRYHVFTNDPTIGRPCMVMEFVSGTALADRIEQGPMPLDEVKVMLRRVASGLDKAHRAGVVHRDLSPDNVILEEGSVEHAKLIDFGIAKSSNFGSGTLLQGQFAGKFNWVSPEQLGAYGGQVDGRSDIYSLGLIIAGASRGQVLQMGASIVDAVGKRATVPALDGVDPALVPLLTWMLQPDPGQRIESMAKVIAVLDDPSLIPQAAAPAAPDPNRTVIEPLPVMTAPPAASVPPAPVPTVPPAAPMPSAPPMPVAAATAPPPPVTAAPAATTGWDLPAPTTPTAAPPATTPPADATVIAPHPVLAPAVTAPPPGPAAEPEDASPFGAPSAPVQPRVEPAAAPAPAPARNGKGGLITVLILLAVLGGGAGAWFGGVFDSKDDPVGPVADTPVDPPATDTPTPEDLAKAEADAKAAAEAAAAQAAADAKAAEEKAAADAKAAEEAAAAQAAADAKTAEEKAAADAQAAAESAAKAASVAIDSAKGTADGATAARGIAENALTEAEAAVAELAKLSEDVLANPASDSALAAKAAELATKAEAASARADAARDAVTAAVAEIGGFADAVKGQTDLESQMAELQAAAEATRGVATEAAAKAALAKTKAAEMAKTIADADAAKKAEEDKKAAELAADPLARQQAHFAALTPPPCVHVALDDPRPEGFHLTGYAVDTAPLEQIAADWQAATGQKPDVVVNLVNEEQCAVLDLAVANRDSLTLALDLDSTSGVIKSGDPVEGTITGIDGRPFTLFLVNGAGGATNINKWVTTEGGVTRFKFAPRLKEGAPPSPQLLLLVIGDEALAQALGSVKPNVIVRQLADFIGARLGAAEGSKALGLGFFRLEN